MPPSAGGFGGRAVGAGPPREVNPSPLRAVVPTMSTVSMLETASASVGKGMLAGLAGTAAMTISSSAEARLRGRGASTAPAHAAGAVLGVQPRDPSGEQRFNTLVHWGYGISWGAVRGLLGAAGLHGPAAAAAHLTAVWAGEQVVLPATDSSPPAWRWGAKEIGVDLLHHLVYAAVTGAVYDRLDRSRRSGRSRSR